MNNKKALVNYYAKLVNRKQYTMDQVPYELHPDVNVRLKEMEPYKPDPITETPEDK